MFYFCFSLKFLYTSYFLEKCKKWLCTDFAAEKAGVVSCVRTLGQCVQRRPHNLTLCGWPLFCTCPLGPDTRTLQHNKIVNTTHTHTHTHTHTEGITIPFWPPIQPSPHPATTVLGHYPTPAAKTSCHGVRYFTFIDQETNSLSVKSEIFSRKEFAFHFCSKVFDQGVFLGEVRARGFGGTPFVFGGAVLFSGPAKPHCLRRSRALGGVVRRFCFKGVNNKLKGEKAVSESPGILSCFLGRNDPPLCKVVSRSRAIPAPSELWSLCLQKQAVHYRVNKHKNLGLSLQTKQGAALTSRKRLETRK